MAVAYGFQRRHAAALKQVADERLLSSPTGVVTQYPTPRQARHAICAKAPGGGIPAASEAAGVMTLGSATCELYWREENGSDLEAIVDGNGDAITAVIYNTVQTAIDADTYVQVTPPDSRGDRYVNVSDC